MAITDFTEVEKGRVMDHSSDGTNGVCPVLPQVQTVKASMH